MAQKPRPTRIARTVAAGALVGGAALTLAGCGLFGGGIPDSGPLAVYPRPDAGMDALLEGRLVLDPACVLVMSPDGGFSLPVFPEGDARVDDEFSTLTWRGEEYRDGDPIALGGGFSAVQDGYIEGGYLPPGCEGREMFLVSPY